MGLQARLVLYAPDEHAARTAARAAFARIAALEDVMSDYRPASEVMRLGAQAGTGPIPISDELFTVLARAQHLARLSDGAFDVTAGPLVRLWRETRRTGRLPHPDTLAAARARVGYRLLRLDPAARTATLLRPGVTLDLGGIAKGYAADEALRVLAEHGIDRALVELGGDVAVSGPPPGEAGWRIEIAHAAPEERYRSLVHAAVSSSGDTEQFVEIGGRRYAHIVDPATGLGLTTRTAVTVVAPDAFTTDGLATLLAVLGQARGHAFVEAHYPDARAYIRQVDGAGKVMP